MAKRFLDQERLSTDKIRAGLLDGSFPTEKDKPYLSPDAARQFSGIVFGVSPKDGQQLLLVPEISLALNDNRPDVFNALIENHGEGALAALDSYVSEGIQWNDEKEIGSLVNILSCIASTKIADNRLRTLADKVTAYLGVLCGRDAVSLEAFFPADKGQVEKVIACVKKICELVDKETVKHFHRQMLKTVGNLVGARDDIDGMALGLSAHSVLGAFPKSRRAEPMDVNFGVVKLAKFCKTLPALNYSVARILKPVKAMQSEIAKAIMPNAAVQPNLGRAVKYVIESGIDVDWSETVAAAMKHLVAHNGYVDQNIPSRRALDILLFIAPLDKKYRDAISAFLKKGEFYHFVGAQPAERAKKAALLLAVCNPDGFKAVTSDRQIGSSQQGLQAITDVLKSVSADDTKPLLELIREFDVEESLRDFVMNSAWGMFGTLVECSMKEPAFEWFNYNEDDPLDSIWIYGRHLEEMSATDKELKVHQYIEFMQDKHNVIEKVEAGGFTDEDLRCCVPYIQYILKREGCAKRLWDNAISACKGLDEDILKELMANKDFRQLVILIKDKVGGFELGVPFYKALRDVLCGTEEDCAHIRKDIISQCKCDEWDSFVAAMNESYKDSLRNDISKAFVEIDCSAKAAYYSLNRNLICVEKVDDDVLTEIVWQGLVSGEGQFGLLSIAKDLAERKRTLKANWLPSKGDVAKLKEPFERLYAKEKDEAHQLLLKELASYHKVELPKHEEKADAEQTVLGPL